MHEAVGVDPPTYVDDLAALTSDTLQMLKSQTFLIAAANVAGLKADVHTCTHVEGVGRGREVRALLSPLPARVAVRSNGDFSVKGLPASFVMPLLTSADPGLVAGAVIRSSPCKCKVKSMVIPARSPETWREAMGASVFGPGAVQLVGPYLGVTLASPANPVAGPGARAALSAARELTWESATDKLCARAEELAERVASPALRASHWNTYMVPVVLYPAQLANPPHLAVRRILRAQAELFRTGGWAAGSPQLLPLMGGFLRLKGAPRCPIAAAHTSSLLALLGRGAWGPAHLLQETQRLWSGAVLWAHEKDEDWWGPRTVPVKETCVRIDRLCHSDNGAPLSVAKDVLRKAARHIYLALLHQLDQGRSKLWLRRREATRTCSFSTSPSLWRLLGSASGFTTGHHAMRLILGTYRGLAGCRSANTRREHPRRCCSCLSADVALAWVTPSHGCHGAAWCSTCLPCSPACPPPWVIACRAFGDGPGTPLQDAILRAPPNSKALLSHAWSLTDSAFSACPLCGRGEAGSEHLCYWCPAVALGWTLAFPEVPYVSLCHNYDGVKVDRLFAFCQHVIFLYGSLNGTAGVHWGAAGRLIARATRLHPIDDTRDDEFDLPLDDGQVTLRADHVPVWAPASRAGCDLCQLSAPGETRITTGRSHKAGWDPYAQQPVSHVATVRGPCLPGEVLASIAASKAPAHWMHRHGWFPIPRERSHGANAHWTFFSCQHCHLVRADLIAQARIRDQGEVIVSCPPAHVTRCPTVLPGVEVSFDGSCGRPAQGGGGGAAAVFWSPPDRNGSRHIVKVLCVALGGALSAPVVETWGLRLVLLDLCRRGQGRQAFPDDDRTARIIGDNIPVIRYGASQGRLRNLDQAGLLEGPLTQAALQGWELSWPPVHRELNDAADFFAKRAALRAPCPPSPPLFFSLDPHLFSGR